MTGIPARSRQLALYGGSFDPPGRHHRVVVERLVQEAHLVRVIPCGPRPDKPFTGVVPAEHRGALVDLAFSDLPGVQVDRFDLDQARFTPTWALEERYAPQGEVWHVVGADLVAGGAHGDSEIQRQWARGVSLWEKGRFIVLTRPGVTLTPSDLPPHARLLALQAPGKSRDLRRALARGERNLPGLDARVEAYIRAHHLYGTSSA